MTYSFKKIIATALLIFLFSAFDYSGYGSPSNSRYQPLISKIDSLKSIKSLQSDIVRILTSSNIKSTEFSLAIYSADNGKYYYRKNIDKYLTPASTTKVMTTFAALVEFGEDYQVPTCVYTDGLVDSSGVLNGNLYLYGKGDALLNISDMEYLSSQIQQKGITRINGDIIADGTFFDSETSRFKYSGDADVVESIPPITSLSIEKNVVTVIVSAGAYNDQNVRVTLQPDSYAFNSTVKAKVIGGKSRPNNRGEGIKIEDEDIDYGSDNYRNPKPEVSSEWGDADPEPSGRSDNNIKISTKTDKNGFQEFVVYGTLKANKTVSYKYHIANPEMAAVGTLYKELYYDGVIIQGSIKLMERDKPADYRNMRMIAKSSRPLKEILYVLNKNSDNYLAESVFKMIGAAEGDNINTAAKTVERMKWILDSTGIPCSRCRLNDGSGLSRRNLLTTEALIKVLDVSAQSSFAAVFDSSLSVAGIDGTLQRRMSASLAENNLHGKTGTLRNVSALSGYVYTLDGERLAFALIFNGPYIGDYKKLEDYVGKALAQFFFYNEQE